MRKIYLLIIIFILNINVYAANVCETQELNRLKDLASKIEFTYEPTVKTDKNNRKYAEYSITATNLNEDLKVLIIKDYYANDYKEFKDGNKTQATLKGFKEGDRVNVTIKGYVANYCSGKTVTTKTIKLPYYNNFYNTEVCKNYPEFKYCQEYTEQEISSSSFDSAFKTYIESLNNEVIEEEPKEASKDWSLLIYIGMGIFALIMLAIMIKIIINDRKKNSL